MQRHPSSAQVEPPRSVPPDLVGSELAGRYRIDARLGQGGFGVVYLAWDRRHGHEVAVKLLREELGASQSLKRRFAREAKAMMALPHPNIVTITDYGVASGVPYLAMELLKGRALDQELKEEGPLSEERSLFVLSELLQGITYMHERGLVHRDLKPGNVFVQQLEGGRECIKLLDFGLAKFLDGEGETELATLTRTGQVFGTPAFMPPEQLGGGQVDRRGDLYSAAVVLFQMLSGRRPFEGEPHEVLRKVLVEPAPTLASVCEDALVQPALETWFERAMAKEPGDRFQDAESLLKALETIPRPWRRKVDDLTTRAVGGAFGTAETLAHDSNESPALGRRVEPQVSRVRRLDLVGFAKAALRRLVVASAALVSLVSVLVIGVAAAVIYVLSGDGGDILLPRSPGPPAVASPASPAWGPGTLEAGSTPSPSVSAGLETGAHAGAVQGAAARVEAQGGLPSGSPAGLVAEGEGAEVAASAPQKEGGPAASAQAAVALPVAAVPVPEPEPPRAAEPTRPRARDPFRRGTPRSLRATRKRLSRGYTGNERMIKSLRRYNRQHPNDARGHVLMAKLYMNRHWYGDVVNQYGFAYARDPSARGARDMLRHLVALVGEDSAHRQASKLIREAYGPEAVAAVDRAHRRAKEAKVKRRLARLRRKLGDDT